MDVRTGAITTAVSLAGLAALIAWRPMKRWIKKCKRRKGGVYAYRVDHYRNRARRHWGYVGESVSFYFRGRQHMGVSRFDPVTGQVVKGEGSGLAVARVPAQPWSDLNPVMHKVVRLPWWLCWKWILLPLETLTMLVLWPVYNDAKNHWNPRRVTKDMARLQRAARDRGALAGEIRIGLAHLGRRAIQVAGVLLIVAGFTGWALGR